MLRGRRIVITRALHQCAETAELVRQRGGEPVLFPCLHMQQHTEALLRACAQAGAYSDLLVTSVNTVHALRQLQQQGRDVAALWRGKRVACVGERTAQALTELGVRVNVVPPAGHASQQGLTEAYNKEGWPRALLFLRAETGSDMLQVSCTSRGIPLQMVPAYSMVCLDEDATPMRQQLTEGRVDAVLLGSSRTAECYRQRIGDARLASQGRLIAISEQVAAAAEQAGMTVCQVAKRPSFASMLDACASAFAEG